MYDMDRKQVIEIVKQSLRRQPELRWHFSQYGTTVIEHKGFDISFMDLEASVKKLSPRKQEAIHYHVILDLPQKEAANRMGGISPASVGQYTSAACLEIAYDLWGDRLGDLE